MQPTPRLHLDFKADATGAAWLIRSNVRPLSMLSHEEALVHARQHLHGQRPPVEWVLVLRVGRRVAEGWYFDYALEPLRFIRDQESPQFGGAPGFLVKDDGGVRVVGWHELAHLLPQTGAHDVA